MEGWQPTTNVYLPSAVREHYIDLWKAQGTCRLKSMQMMIYSVLHTKGVLGLPMMNRNPGNMKITLMIHN